MSETVKPIFLTDTLKKGSNSAVYNALVFTNLAGLMDFYHEVYFLKSFNLNSVFNLFFFKASYSQDYG